MTKKFKEIREPVQAIFFEQILNGQKTFALQIGDWDCAPNDVIIFEEIDESGQPTGRAVRKVAGWTANTNEIDTFSAEQIKAHGLKIISLLKEEQ